MKKKQSITIFSTFKPFHGHANLSLFEITGFGKLLLTENQQNTDYYFQPGKEIETFKNATELVEKIFYYLNNPEQLNKIASAGQYRCYTKYSMGLSIHKLFHVLSKHYKEKTQTRQERSQIMKPSIKLRCCVLCSYYQKYLFDFYKKNNGLFHEPYDMQLKSFTNDCFGDSDFYSNGLKINGWDAIDIITNCKTIQKQWAMENNCASQELFQIVLEQIKAYHPDVVYIHDIITWGKKEILNSIKPYTKLIVGQIAYPLSKETDFYGFDIIFSSFPHYVERFSLKGITSYYIPLAFDSRVLEKTGHNIQRKYPVTFIGGISTNHQKGIDILERICRNSPIDIWGYGKDSLVDDLCIKKHHHGEAWGLDMFRLMAQSKITINRHIDVAENYANNMRLYEATGCGALLITDYKDNLNDLFTIGEEVIAYRSPEECIDLINYYLKRPHEAERIARAGQQRTLNDHSYVKRMKQISDILLKHLNQ